MQGCAALVKLLDRKAKLLGMDAASQSRSAPPVVVAGKLKSSVPGLARPSRRGRSFVSIPRIFRAESCHDHPRAAKGSSLL